MVRICGGSFKDVPDANKEERYQYLTYRGTTDVNRLARSVTEFASAAVASPADAAASSGAGVFAASVASATRVG